MTNNPNNIGETIRANRVRLGYTQETLANELHVSSQAISKWEKGVNMPDINLLIPLSKALNIGVDQLLGGDRYSELNQAFQQSLKLGDKITLLVCEDALAEFPDDVTFLYRRACTQLFLAKKEPGHTYLNRAIADFERLYAISPNYTEDKGMLAEAYFLRGDRELALELAVKSGNNAQIARFIGGEEEIRFKQTEIKNKSVRLCLALLEYNTKESLEVARAIIDKTMAADRLLNANLICGLYIREAEMCIGDGDTDGFAEKLASAYELALEASESNEKLSFTSPLFDRVYADSSYEDELGRFLSNDVLKNPHALPLKRRIVADGVFNCRVLFHAEWREFFVFCERHINQGNYFNFGTGWDLTEEQIDEIYRTYSEDPKYPNNAPAELWEVNRKQVEHLISKRIMTGYVAHYNDEFYAYCNCGNKNKYAGLPLELRKLKATPDDAKVLSIMEIMVSNTYKNSGLEEYLITETLRKKWRGILTPKYIRLTTDW